MAKYYHRVLMEMELRNFSPRTIEAYTGHLRAFARMFGKSLEQLGENEIRQYLHHLRTVKQVSTSNINIGYCALRFFYEKVLEREWNTARLPHPKVEKKLPVVLSREEVQHLLDAARTLKDRVLLMTTYAAGLRVSETVNLKLTDIDPAKGGTDSGGARQRQERSLHAPLRNAAGESPELLQSLSSENMAFPRLPARAPSRCRGYSAGVSAC